MTYLYTSILILGYAPYFYGAYKELTSPDEGSRQQCDEGESL